MSDSETYARLLLPQRHGYPLWTPEPDDNLSLAYRATGTRIGDLGTISYDGAFNYLFNICEAANDPINEGRTPSDFVPLQLQPSDIRRNAERHKADTVITNTEFRRRALAADTTVQIP